MNLNFTISRDLNGNKVCKVRPLRGRGFSIQTNGNMPETDRKGVCDATERRSAEARTLSQAKGGATVNTFKITFDSGNYLVSRFNGTLHDARQYWCAGTQMNIGNGASDHWERVVSVEQC